MSATADIVVARVSGLSVPSQALRGSSVTVERDGKRTTQRVQTGIVGDSATQVVSGLDAGDKVIDHLDERALRAHRVGSEHVAADRSLRRRGRARRRRARRRWRDVPGRWWGRLRRPAGRARRLSRLDVAVGTAVIDLRDITREYRVGEEIVVRALRGVSLRIERGDYVAIMGSSGSGKSTLMHIVGCLDAPTSGRYLLDGADVHDIPEDELADLRNRKIGFVFQAFNLVARTSALANVELPLTYAGLPKADRRRRALAALDAVGMGDRIHHQPSKLSGGQQQRVAVARAIVTNPAIVLADEPTGNLDSHSTHEVLDVFARLNDAGRTVVMITHEDDVAARAHRVIRLADGEVLSDERT